jgi:hypothetical protein
MRYAYYITGHGFGHAIRACAVCNQLDADARLTIRTSLPRDFFDCELARPFIWAPGRFDCGCVQRDGVTVDIEATLRTYAAIADENRQQLDREAAWIRASGIDAVLSDIVPFACEVAARAGVPCVTISNFSWYDIYEPYTAQHPWFSSYLEEIGRQYSQAGLLCALTPVNAMAPFVNRSEIPAIGRRGTPCGSAIRSHYGITSDVKLALIYLGNYGMADVCWERLAHFDQWQFFGLYPLAGASSNYHIVDKQLFSYQDMSASVDCLIAKLGYGVYTDCLLNGLPLIYLPRDDFAEFPVLSAALQARGGVWRLESNAFRALDWESALLEVTRQPRPASVSAHGAALCARQIEAFCQKSVARSITP